MVFIRGQENFFRMNTMFKILNKLVPEYLSSLVPLRVGDRTHYNLRNQDNLSLVMANHVKTYNSFIPKSVRDWNSLGPIKNANSLEGFKTLYKRDNIRTANKIYNIDHRGGNVHHTRLRLGLSPLANHLFTHNIIDDPICSLCNIEVFKMKQLPITCLGVHILPEKRLFFFQVYLK